jgi:hypothetical protein
VFSADAHGTAKVGYAVQKRSVIVGVSKDRPASARMNPISWAEPTSALGPRNGVRLTIIASQPCRTRSIPRLMARPCSVGS